MAQSPKLSGVRTTLGATLVILTRIVFVVALAQVFVALVPPTTTLSSRIYIAILIAVLGLMGVAAVFRDPFLSWQITLESIAVAGISVGLGLLITLLFDDWRRLISAAGAMGSAILVAGVGSAAWLRYIQAKPRRKRRPPNKSPERTREG